MHGTWSRPIEGEDHWSRDGKGVTSFAHLLAGCLEGTALEGSVHRPVLRADGGTLRTEFQWSGGNSHDDRVEGALSLASHLDAIRREDPDAVVHLVGHSHGGNVILGALYRSEVARTPGEGSPSTAAPDIRGTPGRVVFLGTPFIVGRRSTGWIWKGLAWLIVTLPSLGIVWLLLRSLAESTWGILAHLASGGNVFETWRHRVPVESLDVFGARIGTLLLVLAGFVALNIIAGGLVRWRRRRKLGAAAGLRIVSAMSRNVYYPSNETPGGARYECMQVTARLEDEAFVGLASTTVAKPIVAEAIRTAMRPRRAPDDGGFERVIDDGFTTALSMWSRLSYSPFRPLWRIVRPGWNVLQRYVFAPIVARLVAPAVVRTLTTVGAGLDADVDVRIATELRHPSFLGPLLDVEAYFRSEAARRSRRTPKAAASGVVSEGATVAQPTAGGTAVADPSPRSSAPSEHAEPGFRDRLARAIARQDARPRDVGAPSSASLFHALEQRARVFLAATPIQHSRYYADGRLARSLARFLIGGTEAVKAHQDELTDVGILAAFPTIQSDEQPPERPPIKVY